MDPADALADKLMTKVGLDPNDEKESAEINAQNWIAVKAQDDSNAHHSRLNSNDLVTSKPLMSVGSLSIPKEWSAPDGRYEETKEMATFSSLKDGMTNMLHDLRSVPKSKNVADWNDFSEKSGDTMISRSDSSLSSASGAVKEVVKILHQDTVIRQPASKSASEVFKIDDETYVPAAYLNKLVHGPSAGLRWFRDTEKLHTIREERAIRNAVQAHEDTQALSMMNATQLEARAQQIEEKVHPESREYDSLAADLAREVKMEKRKELKNIQRQHLPTGETTKQEIHPGRVQKPEVPGPSALDSVHRNSKHAAHKMLPIRPEDVHHKPDPTVAPAPREIEQQKTPKTVPTKPVSKGYKLKVGPTPSKNQAPATEGHAQDDVDALFTAHALEGLVDAEGIKAVLDDLGTQRNFNWQRFDLDSDGKLSHTEFVSAVTVAKRFKAKRGASGKRLQLLEFLKHSMLQNVFNQDSTLPHPK